MSVEMGVPEQHHLQAHAQPPQAPRFAWRQDKMSKPVLSGSNEGVSSFRTQVSFNNTDGDCCWSTCLIKMQQMHASASFSPPVRLKCAARLRLQCASCLDHVALLQMMQSHISHTSSCFVSLMTAKVQLAPFNSGALSTPDTAMPY